MVAKVASLDTMISAALFKYGARLRTVSVLADTVMAARAAELVVVAGADAEEVDGPMIVTSTVTV